MEDKKKSVWIEWIKEIFRLAVFVVIIVIPFRMFIAQPFLVIGDSMIQTFHNKEYLIVDEISYRFKEIKRGDVVIVRFPNLNRYLIKRIIALPGETISFEESKILITKTENGTIKEFELKEEYIYLTRPHTESIYMDIANQNITLRENEYYVMGDNRLQSADSRILGPIEKTNIKGRPVLRLFPFNRIGLWPGKVNTEIVEIK